MRILHFVHLYHGETFGPAVGNVRLDREHSASKVDEIGEVEGMMGSKFILVGKGQTTPCSGQAVEDRILHGICGKHGIRSIYLSSCDRILRISRFIVIA